MKYKLINKRNKESFICDKITIDGLDYYVNSNSILPNDFYYSKVMNKINHYIEIRPLTSPNLEDLKVISTNDSSLSIPKVVDIDVLSKEYSEENPQKFMGQLINSRSERDFKVGFDKSNELSPFSADDMIEFSEWCQNSYFYSDVEKKWSTEFRIYDGILYTTNGLLEIWQNNHKLKTLYYEAEEFLK